MHIRGRPLIICWGVVQNEKKNCSVGRFGQFNPKKTFFLRFSCKTMFIKNISSVNFGKKKKKIGSEGHRKKQIRSRKSAPCPPPDD